MEEGADNVLRVDVLDTMAPDTEVNIFFKGQKFMHVTCVKKELFIDVSNLTIRNGLSVTSNINTLFPDHDELLGSVITFTMGPTSPARKVLGSTELSWQEQNRGGNVYLADDGSLRNQWSDVLILVSLTLANGDIYNFRVS